MTLEQMIQELEYLEKILRDEQRTDLADRLSTIIEELDSRMWIERWREG